MKTKVNNTQKSRASGKNGHFRLQELLSDFPLGACRVTFAIYIAYGLEQ